MRSTTNYAFNLPDGIDRFNLLHQENNWVKADTEIKALNTGKVNLSIFTAINDFIVGSGNGAAIKKTPAEIKTILSLNNVDNTSDANKPISTATQTALDGKLASTHAGATGTAHGAATTSVAGFMSSADKTKLDGIATGANNYTHPANHPPSIITQDANNRFVTDAEKTTWNGKQAALGFTPENSANKGVANGYASLGSDGKVLTTQLPSFVDDVLEYTNFAAFPATGETGKIYVALDTNKTYRWSGSAYIFITSGAVDSVAGKTGVVTLVKADVGLGNVDNTADSAKNVLSATKLTTARTINGVSFDGTANITVADNTKEPVITKNTAFNVNFETTATNIKMDGVQSLGALSTVARADHVHPTDTSRAPLASPTFTGTPAAPTPATDTNTTQIATTAYVKAQTVKGTSTIPAAGWVANTGDYPLKYSLAIAGVVVGDWVDVTIDKDYLDVASAAEMSSTVEEYAGGITLFAKTAPTVDIPIRYKVDK